jgi:hypothetical protein
VCALVSLCFVIGGPVLRVSLLRDSNTLRHDGLTVAVLFALDRIFDSEDMFAPRLPKLEVWTGAARRFRIGINGVILWASL